MIQLEKLKAELLPLLDPAKRSEALEIIDRAFPDHEKHRRVKEATVWLKTQKPKPEISDLLRHRFGVSRATSYRDIAEAEKGSR